MYIGTTWRTFHTEEKGDITIRMVYEIIDRTTDADGQEMLFADTEFNMYMTSLSDSDEDVISLYHNHAICEQFHSEIKSDMGIERLPSGKFDTNALILKLGMIAYNILRIIGTEAMKKQDMPIRHSTIKRRRIKTVIEQLSADVLKTVEFDVAQFEKQIEYIDICYDCTVKFHICDGRVETRTWQIRSRAESWTHEMREEARRKSCRKSQ